MGDDVAVVLHRDLPREEFGRRRVADGDKHTVELALFHGASFHVLDHNAGDALGLFRAFDLFERAIPHHLDARVIEEALLQNLLQLEGLCHQPFRPRVVVDRWQNREELFAGEKDCFRMEHYL